MASFLDLQLAGLKDKTAFTIFALVDKLMIGLVSNFSDYASIFFRTVVPCKIPWSELVNFPNGSLLETYTKDFKLKITRTGDEMMINGLQVTAPDMYCSNWLAVHGLGEES